MRRIHWVSPKKVLNVDRLLYSVGPLSKVSGTVLHPGNVLGHGWPCCLPAAGGRLNKPIFEGILCAARGSLLLCPITERS